MTPYFPQAVAFFRSFWAALPELLVIVISIAGLWFDEELEKSRKQGHRR